MPRNNNNNGNSENNGEFEVFYIRAKNISSDLNSAAQAIANAIRPLVPQPPIIVTNAPARQIDGKANNAIGSGQTALDLSQLDETDGVQVQTDEEVKVPTPAPKRAAREKTSFQGKPDNTIDWEGSGMPFLSYFKEKNPQETINKYLVIAAWFKKYAGKASIDNNIIYNAYRMLGWQVLSDVGQPFQEGAKPRNGYFTREEAGLYAITSLGLKHIGETSSAKANDQKAEPESKSED